MCFREAGRVTIRLNTAMMNGMITASIAAAWIAVANARTVSMEQ